MIRLWQDAKLPTKNHYNDAGLDLYSHENTIILNGSVALVSTGIAMAIPDGYCGVIKDRSGIAVKRGLEVVAGIIDSQYRGEIKIAFVNNTSDLDGSVISKGERVAQMLILPVPKVDLVEVSNLDETERGKDGFGSSGTA